MKQIWRVARRELRAYFDQPTAYVLLIAFLLVALYIAFRTLYASGAATLRPAFTLLPWAFAIFVPAMTMRALAEERRSGTLEWLAAQPITELELVLGKLLGNLLFVLTTLVGTLPTAIGVLVASDADVGIVVAQYAGAVLLAIQMTAIGIWASSATRHNVTAFILGLGVSWGLAFLGDKLFLGNVPPAVAVVAADLSVLSHFESVARGVIDTRDVFYFLSIAVLFTGLAYFNVTRPRLSPARGALRRLQIGIVIVAAGVVSINLLGRELRGRLDLTKGRLYTLGSTTVEVLHGLTDPITIKLFASRALPAEALLAVRDVRDMLADFETAANGKIRVDQLDPDASADAEREAVGAGLQPIQFSILRGNEFQVRRGWFAISVASAGQRKAFPILRQTENLEYQLVATISSLTTSKKPRVAFLTGFGARTAFSYDQWRELLGNRYQITSIYSDSGATPTFSRDSIDVLVVAGPRRTIDSTVVGRVEAYLDSGGPALLLLDGTDVDFTEVARPFHTGLEPLLERRGVRLGQGIVFDLRSNERTSLGGQDGTAPYITAVPMWPHVRPTGHSPIIFGLSALTLPWPTPLDIVDTSTVTPLWTTTEAGGRHFASDVPVAAGRPFRPDMNSLSPQVVAVAIAPKGEDTTAHRAGRAPGRLVVVGDAGFLENRFAKLNPQNPLFAANSIDWLLQDERLIRIRSKDRTPPPLVFSTDTKRSLFQWGNQLGIPILIGLFGVARIIQRRRRSTKRWEPEPRQNA